jgi:nicotinamide-nucleotide amidase
MRIRYQTGEHPPQKKQLRQGCADRHAPFMKASIIAIGNEILVGQVRDTNSNWIAQTLRAIGVTLTNIYAVADTEDAVREALSLVEGRQDLVIMTGGLGPTSDDITRKVLASYFNTELVFSEEVMSDIEAFLLRRGRSDLSRANLTQAYVLKDATVLRNPIGTAPGSLIERNGTIFVSLPGVPFEMKELMTSTVIPEIKKRFSLPSIFQRTVLTHGIAESDLAEMIATWEQGLGDISLAYLPSPGLVRLRLTKVDADHQAAKAAVERAIDDLRPLLGDAVFGYDDDTMEQVVGELLLKKGAACATAESCTGGAIAARITRIPGASAYFKGAVVAYSNEAKEKVLGVPKSVLEARGAVSREVVEIMARNVLDVMGADFGIAVSGIAGPTGGSPDKPVGLVWLAAACRRLVVSHSFQFGERRDTNIARSVMCGLNMLRKLLIEEIGD